MQTFLFHALFDLSFPSSRDKHLQLSQSSCMGYCDYLCHNVFLAMFQQLPHFSLIVHQRWKTPFEKMKNARKYASFNFLY